MIIATNDTEDELVSYHTLEWIEQNCTRIVNQTEIRSKLGQIKYEWQAIKLIEEMQWLIPGFHYTPHKLDEQFYAIRFLVDKDNYHDKHSGTT